jgi:hypothetical protein
MLFRAVMVGLNHSIKPMLINTAENWFDYNGRSYFKDTDAVFQVVEEGDEIKNIVEAIYLETNPLPFRSKLDAGEVTLTHFEYLISKEANKPALGFWESLKRIFGAS